MNVITTVGFDADDTLWQNEQFYHLTHRRFEELLRDYIEPEALQSQLLDAERRNVGLYGFGAKSFTLSMIETAISVSDGRVSTQVIRELINAGREMLEHPVEPLPYVRETLDRLRGRFRLVVITKGDLFHQERKMAASGLGEYFDAVEIVSDKTPHTYERIFARHGDGPGRSVMVGNSLKSDVLPALDAGSWGIYVPHPLTWTFEHAEKPDAHPRFVEIAHLGELDDVLGQLAAAGARTEALK
jgi:putative hydrolase of the HAD superfamily